MSLYASPSLLAAGVVNGTTGRQLGNMRQAANTHALFSSLDIPEENILRFHQIHSDRIVKVSSIQQARTISQTPLLQADAWVLSHCPGWGAAILTADCVPLVLWDEQAGVVGLAHCGWRGVAAQLPGKMVQAMHQEGATGNIRAWIGPHIQNCCFEVQQDVASQFPQATEHRDHKLFVNLNTAIIHQLEKQGISDSDIQQPYYCTCGDKARFFSFRRDHTKDAMLTFVYFAHNPSCIERMDFIK